MFQEKKKLEDIKLAFDTDKDSKYLINYEHFFDPVRDKDIKLLELGVYKGGSLLLWEEYFKNGVIVGVDINDVNIKKSERLHFFKGSQADEVFLTDLAKREAPQGFDIIIDDASHYGNLTKKSFLILFKKCLKPGGIYVIEDWGTGYWNEWPDGEEYRTPTDTEKIFPSHQNGMVGFIKQLIDDLASCDITHEKFGIPPSRRSLITEMSIYPGQVFLRKSLI